MTPKLRDGFIYKRGDAHHLQASIFSGPV